MDAMELRPLSTGEILDRTFTLYRQNFLLFLEHFRDSHVLVLVLNLLRVSPNFFGFVTDQGHNAYLGVQ